MKDKVVVITGASSGIGLSLAKEYAKNGSKVVIAARNLEKLNELKQELSGSEILAVKTDVSIEEDCKQLITETINRFGMIDVLINNAGVSMRSLFADLDLEVFKRVMNINFWGTVYCTKFALKYLLQSKGSVVGVSSISGFIGLPARCAYSASKYAMHGFLETLRTENMKTGLHVLIAAPGFTQSNIRKRAFTGDGTVQAETPRDEDKMMTSEEVAGHIYNAVLKRKRTLILTSQGVLTVKLKKFFPGFIDKQAFNLLAKEPDSPLK